jgi:uncharacterized protein YbgA (DUF1722 family)/uncharacterized protein YbbK (DUF523 family)
MTNESSPNLRIGISSCLLGEEVRYNGGHKLDTLITETLGRFCEWVPVCPEVEMGLGTPRESLRLVGSAARPRMTTVRSGQDHTEAMHRFAKRRVEQLARLDLHGYILKKDSPSCGMERVKVYGRGTMPRKEGRGLFAAELMDHLPSLPCEEEGRLKDPALRENFVERIFARFRWLALLRSKPRAAALIDFHTRHKLALMAHSEQIYRRLGRLVARAGRPSMRELLPLYEAGFADALRTRATPRKNSNVLYHMLGFLKKTASPGDREELVSCIEEYRKGLLPLIVPITLLKHHFRNHPAPWISRQTYLNPYPAELMLRNSV